MPLCKQAWDGTYKMELEDLSLRYINPEKYFEIAHLVSQSKMERDQTVQAIIEKIQSNLKSIKYQCDNYRQSKKLL